MGHLRLALHGQEHGAIQQQISIVRTTRSVYVMQVIPRVIPTLCRCGKIPAGCDQCDDACSGGRRIDIVEVKKEISWKKVSKSMEIFGYNLETIFV